jgi:YegS/Rv2252/BmrU family lipid kinase
VRVAAIINPISGAGADRAVADRRIASIRAACRQRGIDPTIALTERGGHAREFAADAVAAGVDLLIVWGGDGTINEAGSALLDTNVPLGVVPAGSGNGLAAALGVSRDPAAALAAALDGAARAIDVGTIDGRPFFNIAGIGADAHIAHLFNQRGMGSRGGWPYVFIGLREAYRYSCAEYEIQLDAEAIRTRALVIAFANGREYGMGARIAPQAALDDGLLEAVVVEDRSVLARFWDARHLARGTVEQAPRILFRKVTRGLVRGPGPLQYHVDGEVGVAGREIHVGIRPKSLKVQGC